MPGKAILHLPQEALRRPDGDSRKRARGRGGRDRGRPVDAAPGKPAGLPDRTPGAPAGHRSRASAGQQAGDLIKVAGYIRKGSEREPRRPTSDIGSVATLSSMPRTSSPRRWRTSARCSASAPRNRSPVCAPHGARGAVPAGREDFTPYQFAKAVERAPAAAPGIVAAPARTSSSPRPVNRSSSRNSPRPGSRTRS